jgi:hypothetical protein
VSETKSVFQAGAEGKPIKVGYITLAVHHVKKEDAGVYSCKILDHNHLTSSTNYFVVVHSNIFEIIFYIAAIINCLFAQTKTQRMWTLTTRL